jgi:hypothetical protein
MGVMGSQLTRSVFIDWMGWLISYRTPKSMAINMIADGMPASAFGTMGLNISCRPLPVLERIE